ncbi:hypothetical protein AB0I72_00565 [Nocardiopsis sp. NPDC049922]|uniref:hypothetical protein n=1 Tax=Nocardiopsis sp. NPDC049922 TaxID=3155157 RepID=UPI0033ED695F
MRRVAVALVGVVMVVSGCGGSEEAAPTAADVPDYEVVTDEERVTELLSEGVDAEGAEAIINQVVAENSETWEDEHNVQVIATADAGSVVCRARWVEDEQAAEVFTGGSVTSEDGEWPVVELDCFDE